MNYRTLTPYDVSPYSHMSVWWKCEKGHKWEAAIANRHRLNRGCPYCWKIRRSKQ